MYYFYHVVICSLPNLYFRIPRNTDSDFCEFPLSKTSWTRNKTEKPKCHFYISKQKVIDPFNFVQDWSHSHFNLHVWSQVLNNTLSKIAQNRHLAWRTPTSSWQTTVHNRTKTETNFIGPKHQKQKTKMCGTMTLKRQKKPQKRTF